jgi:hypothetical protein
VIAGLPLASWLLLLFAVGTGLALVLPFWISQRRRRDEDDSPDGGGDSVPDPSPLAPRGPGASAGVER